MKDWRAELNALPYDVRTIFAAMDARLRIQHLNFEKKRLKSRYAQSAKEINQHIKSCEKHLKELEEEGEL